jgi:hypothetical protein
VSAATFSVIVVVAATALFVVASVAIDVWRSRAAVVLAAVSGVVAVAGAIWRFGVLG